MGWVELEVLFSAARVAVGKRRGWVVANGAYIPTKNVGTYTPPASPRRLALPSLLGERVAARIERGRIRSEGAGSNPSPVPGRLEKAPSRSTLSPQADRYPYRWLDTGGAMGARLELQRGPHPALRHQANEAVKKQAVMLSSSEASAFIFLKTNNCRFFGPKNGPQNDRVGRFFHTFNGLGQQVPLVRLPEAPQGYDKQRRPCGGDFLAPPRNPASPVQRFEERWPFCPRSSGV